MAGAGVRVAEVAGVRLANLDQPLDPGRLTKLRVQGKGQKERVVWLISSLWETLQAWLAVRPAVSTDYLFLNRHGQPISVAGIQFRLKQYCHAANVQVSCHRLRQPFAPPVLVKRPPQPSPAPLLGDNRI